MQAPDFVERQIGAGRVVGIGEEHDLVSARVTAARMASTSARSSVSFTVTGVAAGRLDLDPVDQEAVLGENRFVAGPQIGLRQQPQNLVGAVAST